MRKEKGKEKEGKPELTLKSAEMEVAPKERKLNRLTKGKEKKEEGRKRNLKLTLK